MAEVTGSLEAFRFNDAAGAAYRFVWNLFCDWYLEFAKPVFAGVDEAEKAETQATAAYVLDGICALLHPFMPFITEELWRITGENGPARIQFWLWRLARRGASCEPGSAGRLDAVIGLISTVRSIRSELNVPAGATVPLILVDATEAARQRTERWSEILKRLGRFESISFAAAAPQGAVQAPLSDGVAALPLADVIDVAAEAARLRKEAGKLRGDAAKLEGKLANPGFLAKAGEDVIEETRERFNELQARVAKLEDALVQIGG